MIIMKQPMLDMEIQLSSAFRLWYGLSPKVNKEKTKSTAKYQKNFPSRSLEITHKHVN